MAAGWTTRVTPGWMPSTQTLTQTLTQTTSLRERRNLRFWLQKLETVWQSAKKYDHEDMAQPTPAAHGSNARLKAGEPAGAAPVRLLSSSA